MPQIEQHDRNSNLHIYRYVKGKYVDFGEQTVYSTVQYRAGSQTRREGSSTITQVANNVERAQVQ